MEKKIRFSPAQRKALNLATKGTLVCPHGNQFFLSGTTDLTVTCERATLESLRRQNLLSCIPGLSGRGEYTITEAGRAALEEK